MTPFSLKIVTPDGLIFDGQAEELVVRTTSGDLGILAGHINCVAPLGMGRATVIIDGKRRYAACIGGMVSVVNGEVTLVPTTFEWAESIDQMRAEASQQRAERILHKKDATDTEVQLAQARLHRALVRKSVASYK
ncbi:MAG: ATP synthase F1 subunit epsilon [Oscillospiraceae bacterium]|nr:ATP synthase F1 subunit epsilon [Oscillospiraceae bacterium]